MKRPSFQFYPGDWLANSNLRRCTFEERGIWIAVMCLLHDQEPYGIARWPLAEIAQAVGCPVAKLKNIAAKGVLKGDDKKLTEALIYTPRSGRKNGAPVTLIEVQDGPIWYSSRMVEDEHKRIIRGEHGATPKDAPKPPFGDGIDDDIGAPPNTAPSHVRASRAGASSSSSSSPSGKPKPKPSSSSGDDGDGDAKPFDVFWEAYPWKAGKQDAQKAWAKIKPDTALLQIMLEAIGAQLEGADWKRDNGQYIPRAATWLRGGRWLDEVRPYVAPPLKLPPGWWETRAGLEAAGAMLKPPLTPNPGEYPKDFAQRIRVALGQVDPTPSAVLVAPVLPPAQYVPPTVPEGVQLTDEQREARREEFREQLAKLKQAGGLAVAGIAQPDRDE